MCLVGAPPSSSRIRLDGATVSGLADGDGTLSALIGGSVGELMRRVGMGEQWRSEFLAGWSVREPNATHFKS